jgi:hypothetical protein
MTRRSKGAPRKKHGGGLIVGMRSGVRRIAGAGEDAHSSKRSRLVWNVVTVVLVIVTAAILLRRFGVISF